MARLMSKTEHWLKVEVIFTDESGLESEEHILHPYDVNFTPQELFMNNVGEDNLDRVVGLSTVESVAVSVIEGEERQ